ASRPDASFCFVRIPRPSRSTLFPYTTLFRSAVVADWNAGEARLTVYQGTQAPHMVQNLAALHLGLEEAQVRIVSKDVGGSFGIRSEEHTSELQSQSNLVCRLLLEKKKYKQTK